MDVSSNQHIIKTTKQWNENSMEYWVIPSGCLCIELTPKGTTLLKIGEGNKYFYELPYVTSTEIDLSNYYNKDEVNNIIKNLQFMSIVSTDIYPNEHSLPKHNNSLGDVRFVESINPSLNPNPVAYTWNTAMKKWIPLGYNGIIDIDLSEYAKKNDVFPRIEKLEEDSHTHKNKQILDKIEEPFTNKDKQKLDSLTNYDDKDIKKDIEVLQKYSHNHKNIDILNQTNAVFNQTLLEKINSLHNYDDSKIIKMINDISKTNHTHDNKTILDNTSAAFTVDYEAKLKALSEVRDYYGATEEFNGIHGLVPAAKAGENEFFLRGDGTWAEIEIPDSKTRYEAGDGIEIIADYQQSTTFPLKIFGKSTMLKEYIIYGNNPPVGDWDGSAYRIPVIVSAEGRVPVETMIRIPTQLSEGDYIDYEKQIYSHYRTQIHYGYTAGASRSAGLKYDGTIVGTGSMYTAPGVTEYIEVSAKYTYLVRWKSDMGWSTSSGPLYPYYHIFYDSNKNILSRISIGIKAGDRLLTPPENAKYLRLTTFCDGYNKQFGELYRIGSTVEPIILPRVMIHANVISYVDVNTTTKPAEMYIEAEIDQGESEEESKITGVIYNLGVLDLIQDEENKNKVTVVFKDSTKDIIFEDGGSSYIEGTGIEFIEVEDPDLGIVHSINVLPATSETLGGIIVGEGLSIDENNVVSVVFPDPEVYTSSDGIDIIDDEEDPHIHYIKNTGVLEIKASEEYNKFIVSTAEGDQEIELKIDAPDVMEYEAGPGISFQNGTVLYCDADGNAYASINDTLYGFASNITNVITNEGVLDINMDEDNPNVLIVTFKDRTKTFAIDPSSQTIYEAGEGIEMVQSETDLHKVTVNNLGVIDINTDIDKPGVLVVTNKSGDKDVDPFSTLGKITFLCNNDPD